MSADWIIDPDGEHTRRIGQVLTWLNAQCFQLFGKVES